jgi:DNA-binding transcriptional LysR family regulator
MRSTVSQQIAALEKAIGGAVFDRPGGPKPVRLTGDDLRCHELRPALPPREIFLLWRAGRTHSPLAARAIEIAVEVVRELDGSVT